MDNYNDNYEEFPNTDERLEIGAEVSEVNTEVSEKPEEGMPSPITEPSPTHTELLSEMEALRQQVEELQDTLANVVHNTQLLVQNQSSAQDVAVMRRENEAFRSDSNMKLMRAYGIDAMIKTYQSVCDRLFVLNHTTSDADQDDFVGEKKAYEWVLKRMTRHFKKLGIRLQTSELGDKVDEERMVVYGSEGEDVDESLTMVLTNNEMLKDTVKESVSPAFVWTIPSLIGEQKEWVMEPEKICMYKVVEEYGSIWN